MKTKEARSSTRKKPTAVSVSEATLSQSSQFSKRAQNPQKQQKPEGRPTPKKASGMTVASPIPIAMPPLLAPVGVSHNPASADSAVPDIPKGLEEIQKRATDFGQAVGHGLEGLGKLVNAGLRTLRAEASEENDGYREIGELRQFSEQLEKQIADVGKDSDLAKQPIEIKNRIDKRREESRRKLSERMYGTNVPSKADILQLEFKLSMTDPKDLKLYSGIQDFYETVSEQRLRENVLKAEEKMTELVKPVLERRIFPIYESIKRREEIDNANKFLEKTIDEYLSAFPNSRHAESVRNIERGTLVSANAGTILKNHFEKALIQMPSPPKNVEPSPSTSMAIQSLGLSLLETLEKSVFENASDADALSYAQQILSYGERALQDARIREKMNMSQSNSFPSAYFWMLDAALATLKPRGGR